jgi:hypothetical protein
MKEPTMAEILMWAGLAVVLVAIWVLAGRLTSSRGGVGGGSGAPVDDPRTGGMI